VSFYEIPVQKCLVLLNDGTRHDFFQPLADDYCAITQLKVTSGNPVRHLFQLMRYLLSGSIVMKSVILFWDVTPYSSVEVR
jgi:hypothetical protein